LPNDNVVTDDDRNATDVHPAMVDPSIVTPLFAVYDARKFPRGWIWWKRCRPWGVRIHA